MWVIRYKFVKGIRPNLAFHVENKHLADYRRKKAEENLQTTKPASARPG